MAPVPKSPFTLKASSHAVPPQAPSSPPRADKNFWELNFKLPKHHKMLRSEWIMASTAVLALQVEKGWETLKSHPTPRKGFRSAGVKQDQHWLLPWQVCWCSEESLHMKYLFTCWRAFFFFHFVFIIPAQLDGTFGNCYSVLLLPPGCWCLLTKLLAAAPALIEELLLQLKSAPEECTKGAKFIWGLASLKSHRG